MSALFDVVITLKFAAFLSLCDLKKADDGSFLLQNLMMNLNCSKLLSKCDIQ